MRVHATQAAKATRCYTGTLKIGKLDPPRIPHDHILDISLAIHQNADLPSRFMGQLSQLPREFRRNNLMWRNASRIKLLYAAQLIRLQALSIPQRVMNSEPPGCWVLIPGLCSRPNPPH